MIEVKSVAQTCSACPAQWEGETSDARPIYVRYRWGYLSVSIGEPGQDIFGAVEGPEVFGKEVGGGLQGFMTYAELRRITTGMISWPDTSD